VTLFDFSNNKINNKIPKKGNQLRLQRVHEQALLCPVPLDGRNTSARPQPLSARPTRPLRAQPPRQDLF